MYEEEYNKNVLLNKELNKYKLENSNLQYELKYKTESFSNKLNQEVKTATTSLIEKLEVTEKELEKHIKKLAKADGQLGHRGTTLTKEKMQELRKLNPLNCIKVIFNGKALLT